MKEILLKYANYNFWANDLLISLIDKEKNDVLDKNIISSFPSVKETVFHIWGAEYIWLKRLKGESLTDWPSKNFKGTFAEAKEQMLLNEKAIISFVQDLPEDKLSDSFLYKNIEGKTFSNTILEAVHHCMNHSTYHRGQIVTMLRQLGVTEIPSTDFIAYCRLVSTKIPA